MAKKIRMTFKTVKYNEISIVDDTDKILVMTDVASYMMEHAEGFLGYSVETFEEAEEE